MKDYKALAEQFKKQYTEPNYGPSNLDSIWMRALDIFADWLDSQPKEDKPECTCGEPHISSRIQHCYDGKPCYVKDYIPKKPKIELLKRPYLEKHSSRITWHPTQDEIVDKLNEIADHLNQES